MDNSNIKGVYVLPLKKIEDDRGWLVELFRSDQLLENIQPEMSYISMTLPGVSRGPHEHLEQSDVMAFVGPGEFEVHLWERRTEESFMAIKGGFSSHLNTNDYIHHEKHRFGRSNPAAVVIPPGIVHAYKNVSEEFGYVMNFPNKLYAGPGKLYPVDEIRHEENKSGLFRLD
jgi:dTDP-4-dehydrorhamnose 3,5-epimerase